MNKTISSVIQVTVIALIAMLLVACGGGGEEPRAAPEGGSVPAEFEPAVQPITGPEADVLLEVANDAGNTPCGIFDVGTQGDRIVNLSDYENCQPSNPSNHDIACLNSNGQWTDEFVSDFSYGGETVEFVSGQTGTCGIFLFE